MWRVLKGVPAVFINEFGREICPWQIDQCASALKENFTIHMQVSTEITWEVRIDYLWREGDHLRN
jgi:hypothetical protein